MTDPNGTADAGPSPLGPADNTAWSVDGWKSSSDGLSDTVVRMPKVPAEPEPWPVAPSGSAPRPPAAAAPSAWAPAAAASAVTAVAPAVSAPVAKAPVAGAPAANPPAPAASSAAPQARKSGLRRTRKARLRLSRIDPWSVMKTSFLFSIAFGIMFWVATWLLWTVVVQSGLFEAINSAILNIIQNPSNTTSWRIEDYISTNKVLGIAALIGVVNVVISTALGTIFAFLYNLSANVLGGLELTLAED